MTASGWSPLSLTASAAPLSPILLGRRPRYRSRRKDSLWRAPQVLDSLLPPRCSGSCGAETSGSDVRPLGGASTRTAPGVGEGEGPGAWAMFSPWSRSASLIPSILGAEVSPGRGDGCSMTYTAPRPRRLWDPLGRCCFSWVSSTRPRTPFPLSPSLFPWLRPAGPDGVSAVLPAASSWLSRGRSPACPQPPCKPRQSAAGAPLPDAASFRRSVDARQRGKVLSAPDEPSHRSAGLRREAIAGFSRAPRSRLLVNKEVFIGAFSLSPRKGQHLFL